MQKSNFYVFLLLPGMMFSGCTDSPAEAPPEAAYRRFMLTLLTPTKAEIVELIQYHPQSEILWDGQAYPPPVAAELAKQYRKMEITRANPTDPSGPDNVYLNSSAVPVPLKVSNVDGKWLVDAGPLIDLRKAVKESKAAK